MSKWRTFVAEWSIPFVIGLAVFFVFVVLILPPDIFLGGSSRRQRARRSFCQANLKQIALGIKQYIQDYDDKFPIVGDENDGWMVTLQPYIKSIATFQCPAAEEASSGSLVTDYYYNARLSNLEEAKVKGAEFTIATGDGEDNSPSNYSLTQLPKGWVDDSNSPAHRHFYGANYGFADGHVKWYKPTGVTNEPIRKQKPTFQVR